MNNENVTSEYPKVRALTRKDRKTLSGILKIFAERSGNSKIMEMLPGRKGDEKGKGKAEDVNEQAYSLIKSIMDSLLKWTEEELADWFMGITGISDRDKWDKMPFDVELYVIDELLKQKGFNNFFSRAWGLYKRIPG